MTIKLTEEEKNRVLNSKDIYPIMQGILSREEKIDQDREHFWIIRLATDNRIKLIELISLGTTNKVLVEPMEVFSLALQKRAVKMILCHNHPSGNLNASESDIDITDRMYQVGKIVACPIIDHLIISLDSFNSFEDSGLLEKISMSTKYVTPYLLKERLETQAKKILTLSKKNSILVKELKKNNYSNEHIAKLTGLSKEQIEKL